MSSAAAARPAEQAPAGRPQPATVGPVTAAVGQASAGIPTSPAAWPATSGAARPVEATLGGAAGGYRALARPS